MTDNTATEYGGGINCYLGSDPLIESCTICNNTATLAGGGFYAADSAGASVEATTICGNTTDQVAGVRGHGRPGRFVLHPEQVVGRIAGTASVGGRHTRRVEGGRPNRQLPPEARFRR